MPSSEAVNWPWEMVTAMNRKFPWEYIVANNDEL